MKNIRKKKLTSIELLIKSVDLSKTMKIKEKIFFIFQEKLIF